MVVPSYDFGVYNIPGVDYKRPGKVNQDAWFWDNEDEGYSIFGVLDGHGLFGHELSEYFATNLPVEIRQQLLLELNPITELELRLKDLAGVKEDISSTMSLPQRALVYGFHSVHWKAMNDPDIKTGRNGATCITCLIDKETKSGHVAYVGDSRAIRFNNQMTHSSNISVIAQETTVGLPSELERIQSGEGSIRGNNVFYGPVGIAMTRALGDAVMIRAGVIPTPCVDTIQIQEGDVLVLATDGIWDVLTNDDVRNIFLECDSAQCAADTIAKKAKDRWIGDLPIMDEEKADDITVMVLHWK